MMKVNYFYKTEQVNSRRLKLSKTGIKNLIQETSDKRGISTSGMQ